MLLKVRFQLRVALVENVEVLPVNVDLGSSSSNQITVSARQHGNFFSGIVRATPARRTKWLSGCFKLGNCGPRQTSTTRVNGHRTFIVADMFAALGASQVAHTACHEHEHRTPGWLSCLRHCIHPRMADSKCQAGYAPKPR